jgi:predicted nucleic acid-binding protein
MMHVVDSSGWIEYFMDSTGADFVASAIENHGNLIVPAIALYEVHRFLSKQILSADQVAQCLHIMHRGRTIDLTAARAIAASKAAQTYKLAMADAIMYSIACEFNATFWTQDIDYQGLPNVQYQAKPQAKPIL